MIDRKRSLNLLKDQLTAKRLELCLRIEQRHAEIAVDGEPDDEGARAVDQAARDFAACNLEREMRTLAEIDASLRRMAKGEYGVCTSCEQEIPAVRLEALPWTRLCVDCAGGGVHGLARGVHRNPMAPPVRDARVTL